MHIGILAAQLSELVVGSIPLSEDSVKNGELTSIECQSTHSTSAIPHHCILYAMAQGQKQSLDHYQHMFDQLESIPTNSYIHTVCT